MSSCIPNSPPEHPESQQLSRDSAPLIPQHTQLFHMTRQMPHIALQNTRRTVPSYFKYINSKLYFLCVFMLAGEFLILSVLEAKTLLLI